MMQRKRLVTEALAMALSIRQNHGIGLTKPLSVFDLVINLGVELRFSALPSLEGMYSSTPKPAIIVGTLRPSPRQFYTCAHELGHHLFGHGTRVDEYVEANGVETRNSDPDEFLVQAFAGFLLMPKIAVQKSFHARGWKIKDCDPIQFYRIANYFGVGFSTLLYHLRYSLELITDRQFQPLSKLRPVKLRSQIAGTESQSHLVCVDSAWEDVPIDLEVDDTIMAFNDVEFEGLPLISNTSTRGNRLFQAVAPGIGRLRSENDSWARFVRVRPKKYHGRAIFRHLEPDE